MPEQITVTVGDDGSRRFDEVVHNSLPENGNLELAVKRDGTVSGLPAVVIAFNVEIDGEGTVRRAQAVTTLRALLATLKLLALQFPGELP